MKKAKQAKEAKEAAAARERQHSVTQGKPDALSDNRGKNAGPSTETKGGKGGKGGKGKANTDTDTDADTDTEAESPLDEMDDLFAFPSPPIRIIRLLLETRYLHFPEYLAQANATVRSPEKLLRNCTLGLDSLRKSMDQSATAAAFELVRVPYPGNDVRLHGRNVTDSKGKVLKRKGSIGHLMDMSRAMNRITVEIQTMDYVEEFLSSAVGGDMVFPMLLAIKKMCF